MGLFKTITPPAEPVYVEPAEEIIPTFRSRRTTPLQVETEPLEIDAEAEETEHSGVLFDAFVDRMAALRKARQND
ncbi:MAG: hypothetical protein AAGA08_02670 [Pseudomonadota bacterium]